MKNLQIFFLLSIFSFLFSCQTPSGTSLVEKHQLEYTTTKDRMLANKTDILRLISQLPPTYQTAIQEGITSIEKYDLAEFLEQEKMDEEGLLMLFKSINQFSDNIEVSRNFQANAEQTEMYNVLKNRLLENRKFVDPFIATSEKSTDPNQLRSALFLKKIMQYDIEEFVQNSFIGEAEFEVAFTEVNENWGDFITNLMMMAAESELSGK